MSHPLQSDVDLCVAVGIDVSRFDLMDVYTLSGYIQREVGYPSKVRVRELTDVQRAALRDRALASPPPIIKRSKS